jgi:GMP synthase-like glutamine amidotransferase
MGWADERTGHNSFDDEIWILKLVEFTKKVLAQDRVRLIGVCFGHQIIGRALGEKVGRSAAGWEVSVTPMELTAKGKELFGVQELVSRSLSSIRLSRPHC